MSWIQHIGIVCNDIAKSEEFYGRFFGLKKVRETKVPKETIMSIFNIPSEANIVALQAQNDQVVELFDMIDLKSVPEKPNYNSGITHFALFVGDRKTAGKKLEEEGVETIFVDKGKGEFVYFVKDPDGVLIELRD